jgi:hypothetical protein
MLLAALGSVAGWLVWVHGVEGIDSGRLPIFNGLLVLCLLALGALAGWVGLQIRSALHPFEIHILPGAQIMLNTDNAHSAHSAHSVHVQLLAASTLWPHCMLLHFRDAATGRRYAVPVLPDSVSRAEFRALLVACRWLEARHGVLDREKNL